TFLQRCLDEFKKAPFTEFIATQTDFMDEKGNDYPDKNHAFYRIEKPTNKTQEQWKARLYLGNVYFGVGMYRTAAFLQCGGRKTKLGVISDYELYLNLLQRENILVIEEPLTHTRIHGKNMSLLTQAEALNLKKQYFDAKADYYPPRMKVVIAT